MVLGLTGGIACGKSTVANMLADLGSVIIDADKVAREVVEPGGQGLKLVVERFGESVLTEDGELNRKTLGAIVFTDEKARTDLNAILHPLIRKRMEEKKWAAQVACPPLVIMDIPLLYESKLRATVEAVIVVYIPRQMQVGRLMDRDQLTEQEAYSRINSQMDIEEKKRLADYIIDNSKSLENTRIQVQELYTKLTKER